MGLRERGTELQDERTKGVGGEREREARERTGNKGEGGRSEWRMGV